MAKVVKGDLASVNSNLQFIDKMIAEDNEIINKINNFNTASTVFLKGAAYDALRGRLTFYTQIINKHITVCDNLKNNIISVNNEMLNFMEDFESLDDSKIEETSEALEKTKSDLSRLRSLLSSISLKQSDINQIKSAISVLEENIHYLERLLSKLKELRGKDTSLFSKLDKDFSDVNSFETALNSFEVTQIL